MRIFGQLKQPFEELETLIDESDEILKAKTMCRTIISCLNSYRPIKSMKDMVEIYKSIKYMNKLSYYFSKNNNILKEEAIVILEKLIQNSDILRIILIDYLLISLRKEKIIIVVWCKKFSNLAIIFYNNLIYK